jgi:very-short-patch-repair endonuclease
MVAVARRQQGVVTLVQLRACGFTDDAVRGLVARGELRRLHRGVYFLGSVLLPHSAEFAAALACGPGAAVSHRSGLFLYDVLPHVPGVIHVTVPSRHQRNTKGVVVHESGSLRPYELRERHGIPVTAPIRTLIDFAGSCGDDELERAVAEAFALGLTNRDAVLRGVEGHRGRRGVARLAALLDGGSPRRTRSRPERRLLAALRRAHLPEPETDVRLGRWTVDFLWRDAGLVVEVDAYSTHSSPWAFERDRRKDAELTARGLTVQRFTAEMVRDDVASVISWVAARLAVQL